MQISLIKKVSGVLMVTAFGIISAIAAPYEKGQKVDAFKAADQFGAAFIFEPASSRFLLVSHDMETGKKANAVLTALGKDALPAKKAVYVANIHGMPGIGRMFAIPKMKKYAHRIILGDDAELIAKFPQQEGKVTVLKLSSGKVESIGYWTPGVDSLDEILK
jgi:predicted outer membrane lipoprotein